jgi:hypothetical protein
VRLVTRTRDWYGFSVVIDAATAPHLESEIRQILEDLDLAETLTIQTSR